MVTDPFTQLPPGIWRAELQIDDDVILPFNFEITYTGDDMQMYIINGTERLLVDALSFGRTKDLRDTLVASFLLMDTYISAEYKENILQGTWYVNNRENYFIPFVAYHGQAHRITTDTESPKADLSGRWEATFELESPDEYPAIAEFDQNENRLEGTFLTETGDYRYLDGTVQGEEMYLSCFDGSHAFLFKGRIEDNGSLNGLFYSGNHYKTNWVARRNSEARLQDAYALTRSTVGDQPITFSFLNTEGQEISLEDPKYQDKPKIITIMGTWCPNCLDESKFLIGHLERLAELNVEIIALAFERYRDKTKALSAIKNYKERLELPYEVLLAGYYDKIEASVQLPFLDRVLSYPTMLFLDKDNRIKKIHTGFSGPATSEYGSFVRTFESSLLTIVE